MENLPDKQAFGQRENDMAQAKPLVTEGQPEKLERSSLFKNEIFEALGHGETLRLGPGVASRRFAA